MQRAGVVVEAQSGLERPLNPPPIQDKTITLTSEKSIEINATY
jgi:hypothetical protein